MITMRELDTSVGVRDQLADTSADPVVLVNVFTVAPDGVAALLAAWKDDAEYFTAQPGFISAQLHRGVAGSTAFLN